MSAEGRTTDAEWAANLTAHDLDAIISRCVQARDFKGLSAALHLMAVKDPHRAEHWRDTLLLCVNVVRDSTPARSSCGHSPDCGDVR